LKAEKDVCVYGVVFGTTPVLNLLVHCRKFSILFRQILETVLEKNTKSLKSIYKRKPILKYSVFLILKELIISASNISVTDSFSET